MVVTGVTVVCLVVHPVVVGGWVDVRVLVVGEVWVNLFCVVVVVIFPIVVSGTVVVGTFVVVVWKGRGVVV